MPGVVGPLAQWTVLFLGFAGVKLCHQLGEQKTIMFLGQELKHIGGKQLALLTIQLVVFKLWLATVVAFTSFSRGVITFEQLSLCRCGRIQGLLPTD